MILKEVEFVYIQNHNVRPKDRLHETASDSPSRPLPKHVTPGEKGMQPCVTKPVLHESVCSKRRGHMDFLPTSSLLSSPSLGCTLPPVEGGKK